MTKLEQLIAELCPDGVEYKTLGYACLKTEMINWNANKGALYNYIDLTSVDRYTHLISETLLIDSDSAPSRAKQIVRKSDVIFGTTRPTLMRYCFIPEDFNGQICSTGFCVLRADLSKVLPRYVFHTISSDLFYRYVEDNQRGTAYPAISDGDIKKFRFPIPPLPIQEEIVRILDKFTALEAELEAELEARKKQYEYYRNELLTFGDGVEYISFGLIVRSNLGGGTPSKSNKLYWNGSIPWVSVKDIVREGMYIRRTTDHITEEALRDSPSNLIPKGWLIICTRINPGLCSIAEIDVAINQDLRGVFFSGNVSTKYVYYYLQTLSISGKGTTVKGISVEELNRIPIPIPPLAEQERIVAILNRFDALVNDISIGLPAEIAARRKQYECYRDRLLTFGHM